MSWMPFVENCRKFFDEGKINSLYPLVEATDDLYRLAPEKSPFLPPGGPGSEQERIFAQCFFVSHRTLLSAAMAIGSGLPEDGEAITRRALEAAKTCLAIKADSANLEVWLSGEKRLARWKQRGQGQIPKSLQVNYSDAVKSEPLYAELQTEFGSLFDVASHFTPEFFWRYTWEETLPGGGRDFSFGLNVGAIELAFLMLSKHYELIFRVFDRCQDGRMLQNPDVERAHQYVLYLRNKVHELAKPALDALIKDTAA